MLSLTKKAGYGLTAMTHLAQLPGGQVASAREISQLFDVPVSLLMNVLKELSSAGYVESVRGARGGYRLARPPQQISMADLVEALDGPVRLAECLTGETADNEECTCSLMARCPIRDPVHRIQRRLRDFLRDLTLAEIAEPIPDGLGAGGVKLPIYLDNNATTPVDERVLEAMRPYLRGVFGNPASRDHVFGQKAAEAVERARGQVAALIGAQPKDIVFTSGATESDNLAIKGVAEMHRDKGNHIVTCMAEHKAVLDTCKWLAQHGCEVTYLRPDEFGRVSPQQVAEAITDRTILISLMAANNEIGTLHPLTEIGAVAKARGVFFHTDATQAVGKVPIDVEAMGIDLLSLSAHKIYGPKGVGALYVRRSGPRVRLAAQMHGGGHERGMRSGTLNCPGIVGLGAACEICRSEMAGEAERLTVLRDRLHRAITAGLDHVKLNGHPGHRLPNTLNLSFAYVEGEALMMKMPDVAVSSGSACTSALLEPSYVLNAIGVRDDLAHSSIRFSLGRASTAEEMDYAAGRVVRAVEELLRLSPLYEMAQKGVDLSKVRWNNTIKP